MRTLINLVRGLAMVALLVVVARAGDGSKKSYDIPRGDAAAMLKQFSEVSGRETLFPAEVVRGVITNSVKGEFTPEEAIARLLDRTVLTAVADEKTGAFAIRKVAAAQPGDEGHKAIPITVDSEKTALLTKPVELPRYEVLGTRIRQTESDGPSPVSSYSATQIEATGALNLSDFLMTVPQTYGGISVGRNSAPSDLNLTYGQRNEGLVPLIPNPGASPTATVPGQTGVSGVSLRSLGAGSTLVLVDGQRMAQSPSANKDSQSGQGFVDINLIPLGMIDHVEIITDGASAIYGADAVAGVINIVLKKNYTGVELASSYKATQHGGGNEQQTTLTVGFTGDKGKFNGSIAVNYYDRGTLMASDRSFSQNPNHTAIIKGYTAAGAPIYGYDLRLQVGYPATVQATGGAVSGYFDAFPGVKVVQTPTGSATTPALSAFIPKTTIPSGQTTLSYQGQNPYNEASSIELVPWAKRYGALGNFNYTLKNGIQISASGSVTTSEGVASTMLEYTTGTLPATATTNPFNQAVTVAMILPGFGTLTQQTHTQDENGTISATGKMGSTWKWNTDVRVDHQTLHSMNKSFNSAIFTADLANGTFNPFIDSNANGAPSQAAAYAGMALYPTVDGLSILRSIDASANGDLFNIWGGPVKLAFGGSGEGDYNNNTSVSWSAAVTPVATVTNYSTTQQIYAGYGELSLPVFGRPNAIPLFSRFDINAAGRYEHQNNGAGGKAVPKIGISWVPVKSLLLRGSYSEGWRAPSPTENRAAASVTPTSVADPSRGGVVTTVNVLRGPNPSLKPENSSTKFFGLVYETPFVKGLNLTVNYYSTIQKDAIISVTPTTVLANPTLFPTAVVRAPQTAADIAANQPGALVSVQSFFQNFGEVRNDSIDYGAEYQIPWQNLGHWHLNLDTSHTLKDIQQLTPGVSPVDENGDTYASPKWKITGALYWAKGNWTASALFSYMSGFNTNSAAVNALAWSESIPPVQKWDVLAGYRFRDGVWRGYGKDVQVSVGINNLFDKAPPFSDTIYSFDPALHAEYIFGRTFVFSLKVPL